MVKVKTVFICTECGYEHPKWIGKCPQCGQWNSFQESEVAPPGSRKEGRITGNSPIVLSQPVDRPVARIITGIAELDRVLGGGIFQASVNLIAGDPGIGKSTLLLQLAGSLQKNGVSVLYVSAEESFWQIQERARRLNIDNSSLPVLMETELETILYHIDQKRPQVVVIDSIQAVFSQETAGTPGNVSQVRECSSRLFRTAKVGGWSLFLVGHITKEGSIAGPKILEHMVDVVIYFEGDSLYQYRTLRSLKNRFGPSNEIGLFIMEAKGLKEVENPSRLFVSENSSRTPGAAVVCSYEGSRPILAEIQALVTRSNYGNPQRTVTGFDQKRLSLLLAILEKYCGLNLSFFDVFVKIAGGLKIDDPGIDAGICAAIFSSFSEKSHGTNTVYIGEVGLNGDVRAVTHMERRVDEAIKLGYEVIYIPFQDSGKAVSHDSRIRRVKHVSELFQLQEKQRENMKKENR